jgi:hypothetical protein
MYVETPAHPCQITESAHQCMNGYRKGGKYTLWSFTQPLRRIKSCPLQENDETGDYHVK